MTGVGRVVDVILWTRKVALDIIGISEQPMLPVCLIVNLRVLHSCLRYHFNALDDGISELREALHNILYVLPTEKKPFVNVDVGICSIESHASPSC